MITTESEECWYSWIPTNLGILNFNYIAVNKNLIQSKYKSLSADNNQIKIEELSSSFISDSNLTDAPFLIKKFVLPDNESEIFSYTNIEINNESYIDLFKGKIEIIYKDINFTLSSDFEIEKNGKIKFFNFKSKVDSADFEIILGNFKNEEHFRDYIVQIFFVIIKSIVHGDHHHHQKIDVSINVLKNEFKPFEILNRLIKQVKSIEYDIKNFKNCGDELKIKNSIEEMKGYKSYIDTFSELFIKNEDEKEYEKSKNILNNILLSLESSVKKVNNRQEDRDKIITFVYTYLGLFISINLLFFKLNNNLKFDISFEFYYLSLLILFMAFGFHLKCRIKSYIFYKKYYWQEIFYHLNYAKYSELKFLTKIIKIMYLYGKSIYYLLLAIVSILICFVYSDAIKIKLNMNSENNKIFEKEEVTNKLDLLINLNKENIETNNQINLNISKNFDYIDLELIFSQDILFEKSSVFIKNEYKEKLGDFVAKLDKSSSYIIKIDSYSSSEKLISDNTFSDNYQLSEARGENLKNVLLEKLIFSNFLINQFDFLITYNSNSIFDKKDKNYTSQRLAKLKIYRKIKK